jgi:hypothetical protein
VKSFLVRMKDPEEEHSEKNALGSSVSDNADQPLRGGG